MLAYQAENTHQCDDSCPSIELHIIGLGVAEQAELGVEATRALQSAELVFGSTRQLKTVQRFLSDNQQQTELPRLSELKEQLLSIIGSNEKGDKKSSVKNKRTSSIAVLASGDPLYYGIGRWFCNQFSADCNKDGDKECDKSQLFFYPAVSSLQAACHRLGVSLQDVEVLSLHGRPLAKLRTRLRQDQSLLILTDKLSCPQALAAQCIECGYESATFSICENLGYPEEKISHYEASELINSLTDFDPLHVTLIKPGSNYGFLPEFPGIADKHFITDSEEAGRGMISKREVRLSILSLMHVAKGDTVWDIGAGCGGVSVELAYWNPDSTIYAVEHHDDRLRCLEENRQRFGVVSNLHIVPGRAPQALNEQPQPNKVFIGGSDGELAVLLSKVWELLPEGGVLVASAVTENTKQHLFNFWQQRADADDCVAETLQLAVSRGELLAGQLLYRPSLPVNLYQFVKQTSLQAERVSG
ncbi:precorrin-6y C5,15-methyltransferase (decarboxylating) subunit CbiE [uncultured Neptuniibacter sp.]|uniref:precorrin-6y C5,15-methyltransferase (decarboxylating) subunit CbiE n=4 Tax=Neptuniibacter TaxID=459520 RepID=UPI000C3684C4|nr:cobalamin biosynthesis bifunctional protein CbiET [Oceanospirillaceae bacterium]